MTTDPASPRITRAIDTPRLTATDIIMLLANGQRDFSGTNWMGIDFYELDDWDLNGINLTEACLIGITISEQGWKNINFTRADLHNANFVRADLEGADFTGANLEGANFTGAHLKGANFAGTTMNKANLAFADLRGAKNIDFPLHGRGYTRSNMLLWQTIFPDGTLFPGPFLTTGHPSELLEEFNR